MCEAGLCGFAGKLHSCLSSGDWTRYKVADLLDKNKQTISVAGGKPTEVCTHSDNSGEWRMYIVLKWRWQMSFDSHASFDPLTAWSAVSRTNLKRLSRKWHLYHLASQTWNWEDRRVACGPCICHSALKWRLFFLNHCKCWVRHL